MIYSTPTRDLYTVEGFTNGEQKEIRFQKGNPETTGIVGVTSEALIAILIDRLTYFQSQEFHCTENAEAVASLVSALASLKQRQARVKRS